MDRLGVALARRARLTTGVAVLCCDLDRFKVVNEGLGTESADEVLLRVAERLVESVRPGDTVARFGSDEFVLLCSDLTSPRDAVVLCERIQEAVRAPITVRRQRAGGDPQHRHRLRRDRREPARRDWSGTPTPPCTGRRSSGRDRAEVFDDALRHRALDRLDTESGLRRAVDEGRLVVHYQPVIDLRDDRVSGFEALMRWEHPERGLLAPAEFMEVAEETGLIVPAGPTPVRRGLPPDRGLAAGTGGR